MELGKDVSAGQRASVRRYGHPKRTIVFRRILLRDPRREKLEGAVVAADRDDCLPRPRELVAQQAGGPAGAPVSPAVAEPAPFSKGIFERRLFALFSGEEGNRRVRGGNPRVRQADPEGRTSVEDGRLERSPGGDLAPEEDLAVA